jgi:hypothetical protein
LLEKAPFQGPLKLVLPGRKLPQYLGVEAAKSIYVLPSGLPVAKQVRSSRTKQAIAFPGSPFQPKGAEPSVHKRKPLRGSARRPQ